MPYARLVGLLADVWDALLVECLQRVAGDAWEIRTRPAGAAGSGVEEASRM